MQLERSPRDKERGKGGERVGGEGDTKRIKMRYVHVSPPHDQCNHTASIYYKIKMYERILVINYIGPQFQLEFQHSSKSGPFAKMERGERA